MSLITPLDLFRQSTLFRAKFRFLSQVTTKALLEMLQHIILALRLLRRNSSLFTHIKQSGTNGYPIPNPNPKYFSIPDPYPINFQNHRVFRVSGIRENQVFDMNPCALV